MVTVVQLHPQNSAAALEPLAEGLGAKDRALLARALEYAEPLYAGQVLSTGEPTWAHALGLAANLAAIGVDPAGRAAGILFAAPKHLGDPEALGKAFGEEIAGLAAGVEKLYQLRVATRANPIEQNEVLRKMVLGMVEDVRVVLIRLASRTQTLRWFSKNKIVEKERVEYARETLDIYAPLANRLGVFQLKWELEDLSFRFLEPELYRRIAAMLDEKRLERQRYIAQTISLLKEELQKAGVEGEITGRPKHIYSIWNKMRSKSLDFAELYDVRALRIIVPSVKDCYTALGVVHNLWQPIPKEFDDYISRPKGNLYQSLHTAVLGPGGKTLEVQIRTEEMHRQAEYGVAAHWRYKESGRPAKPESGFERKIAWLRELLAWRDEVADWGEKTRQARLDDTVYVLTPQGKVIDLPAGSTPIDFAYALHSDLGHRCRGARRGQPAPATGRFARCRSAARREGFEPETQDGEERRLNRRRRRSAAHPARQMLQAGAARPDPRLRHARQGRLRAPRGLRGAEAPRGGASRAAHRGRVGQGRGELCRRHDRDGGRPARPLARHRRCPGAREDQRQRDAFPEPR